MYEAKEGVEAGKAFGKWVDLALRPSPRPPVAGTFLLNNIHYLNAHVLQSPADPSLPAIVAKPTRDLLAHNQRTAKAGYFDSNFGPLMQALSDDPKEGRTAGKERFTRFYDLLDEVLERHHVVRLLDTDELSELGREMIAEEACKLIVRAFRRFVQRMKDRETLKSISKCPRMRLKHSRKAYLVDIERLRM
ncbi:hypothetical protein APHAL10511_000682 [Amanita phalloides]|nr:hypothetical protein APHAL10511_000682 [Amanita phalloides]